MTHARVRLLPWGLCLLLSFGAPAAARAEDDPYLVRLPSRDFAPRERVEAGALRDDKVFVQFRRTLTAGEQEALEKSGVVFHESLEPFTYLVSIPAGAAEAVQQHALFLGAEPIQPLDKLTAAILRNEIPDHARRPDEGIALFFRFYENVTLEEALAALDAAGIAVTDRSAFLFGNRLEAVATRDAVLAACASPVVRSAHEVLPLPVVSNVQAAGISNVPPVQIAPYNLTGLNVVVGVWDEGAARSTHQDLASRITVRQGAANDHATHVTGTILGSGFGNAAAKGMATSAKAASYDYVGDVPTEQSGASTWPIPIFGGDGIAVSNNSFEYNLGWRLNCPTNVCTMHNDPNCFYENVLESAFGTYDGNTVPWDDLVRTKRLVVVKSAGNQADDCGPADCAAPRNTDCDGILGGDGFWYDNLDVVSTAKNVITVGAVMDDGTTRALFSSGGPADDGRVKPDLVANGWSLLSTGAASDSAYLNATGTSMSGPVVAGVVALIDEEWKKLHASRSSAINKPAPELVKAVLVNTAADQGRPGPDYSYGHGLVQAKEAIDVLEAPNADGQTTLAGNQVRTAFLSQNEVLQFRVSTPAGTPTGPIKTTVAWDDLPGTSSSIVRYCNIVNFKLPCTSNADCTSTNPSAVCDAAPCGAVPCHLKNDLDTILRNAANAVIALPYVPPGAGAVTGFAYTYFNHIDNVETIQASDPNGGDLPLTVYGFTVTGGQQRFTLAANKKLIYLPANDAFNTPRALPALVPADPAATTCPSGETPCPATLYAHNTWDSVNFDATIEAGEPANAFATVHSVWYTWVAPANGQATFDTAGADFDTVLDVWTGNSFATLTSMGVSDDAFGKQSKVTFPAVAGTTYRIRVRGKSPAAGAQDTSQGVFPLNYYVIVCGNGVTEAGETCDDGNATEGDCCSATCALATAGSTCSIGGNQCSFGTCSGTTCTGVAPITCNDGNLCTDDSCNAATGCVYANNFAPCDDGSACTTGDSCSLGACSGGLPPPVPASTPTIGMTSKVNMTWPVLPNASGYDVVRGSLNALRSSGGNFSTSTTTCLGDDWSPNGIDDAGALTVGNGFFYLVRGTSCSGSGTYNTTSPKQVASRDAGVESAPITCSTICTRGKCTFGAPLDPQCDACTLALCGVDPYCCDSLWDNICIEEVRTACGSLSCQESAGTCAHPVCTLGGPLTSGCDNPPMNPSCVATICAQDPYCCNVGWDSQCVGEVAVCGWNCN